MSPCLFNIYTEYLIGEALGINTKGQNITNIIYTDDTIMLTESEQQLHNKIMIDKLFANCEQYGMAMNTKQTKNNDRREKPSETR